MQTRQLAYLDYLFASNIQSLRDEDCLLALLPEGSAIKKEKQNEIQAALKQAEEAHEKIKNDNDLKQSLSLSLAGFNTYKSTIKEALEQAEREIAEYTTLKSNDFEFDADGNPCYLVNRQRIPSLRYQYLKARKEQLEGIYTKLNVAPAATKPEPPKFFRQIKKLMEAFDSVKKFVDGVDDAVSATGRIPRVPTELVNFIAPILNGAFGIIVQGTEAARGLYTGIKNLRKKNPHPMRNGKVLANFLIFGTGTAGVAICIAYLLAITGTVVASTSILNILIPAMVGTIAAIGLAHNIYRYNVAKKMMDELAKTKTAIEACQDELEKVEKSIQKRSAQIAIEQKKLEIEKNPEKIITITNELANLNNEEMVDQAKLVELKSTLATYETKNAHWNHKRSTAVRNMTYRSLEIFAAAVIIVGLILGTAAIIGAASAATFGAAMIPSAIIFTGVGIGFALKLFEHFDKKNNYKNTNLVLNTIKNTFNKLLGRPKTPDLISPPDKKHEIGAEMDYINKVEAKEIDSQAQPSTPAISNISRQGSIHFYQPVVVPGDEGKNSYQLLTPTTGTY